MLRLAHFLTVQVYPIGREEGTMGYGVPLSNRSDELEAARLSVGPDEGRVKPVTAPSGFMIGSEDRRWTTEGAVPNVE